METSRLSYEDLNGNGAIDLTTEIKEENHYYPFGLKHKGYNNEQIGADYNLKEFQGQELNNEFGLNWSSFKWRNYDASLSHFHNIDPLAEEYSYQSPYNFSENRVIYGVELEGLEYVPANKVRVFVQNNGDVRLKMNNMSNPTANRFNMRNSNVKNWRTGEIGDSSINTKVGHF